MDKAICKLCNKQFSNRSNMIKHEKVVHGTDNLICSICLKVFSSKISLDRHAQLHNIVKKKKVSNIFICSICLKDFQYKYKLCRHMKVHNKTSVKKVFKCKRCLLTFNSNDLLTNHECSHLSSKNILKCPICDFSATKDQLLLHFTIGHDIVLETNTHVFNDLNEFELWKEKLEKTDFSCYRVYNKYKRKDGSFYNYYRCHRSGFSTSRGNKQHHKASRTMKIGGFCPSHLLVDFTSSQVTVSHLKTHVGHTNDIEHLMLDKKTREALAQKIALKIPFDTILKDIKDSMVNENLSRIHLIKRQDLRNIKRDFNLKQEGMIRSSDPICGDDQYQFGDNIEYNLEISESRNADKQEMVLIELTQTNNLPESQDLSEMQAVVLNNFSKAYNMAQTKDHLDLLDNHILSAIVMMGA